MARKACCIFVTGVKYSSTMQIWIITFKEWILSLKVISFVGVKICKFLNFRTNSGVIPIKFLS